MSPAVTSLTRNRRILLVDDNPAIHVDFRKVLAPVQADTDELDAAEAMLFGGDGSVFRRTLSHTAYEFTSVFQGQEALDAVSMAVEKGSPYAVAVVDIRMPPGWDGVETVQRLWEVDPRLLVVFCSAYSDYDRKSMLTALGVSDQFVLLRKPFDAIELQQLVAFMLERWYATRTSEIDLTELEQVMRRNRVLESELTDLRKRLAQHCNGKEPCIRAFPNAAALVPSPPES
jgi:CheY-like chemotaxis protein